MTKIKVLDGVTVNGSPVVSVVNWVCACSGGHPVDEPDAKCFRKGGYDAESLVVDGMVVADQKDAWDDVEWLDVPRRPFVNGPGWVNSMEDLLALA